MISESQRLHALTSAVAAAAEAEDLAALGRRAFPYLASAIGACPAILFESGADLESSRAVAGEALPLFPGYMRRLAKEDPVFQVTLGHPSPVHVPTHQVDARAFRASYAYVDFYRLHDFEHKLYVRFAGARLTDPGACSMGMIRGSRLSDFGESEVTFAELALPAFAAAARRFARAATSREAEAAGAIAAERAPYSLALDGAGRVLWISPRAERLLGRALGARRTLPEPIVGEARRLMQLASAQQWDPAKPLRFSVRARLEGGSALEAELWIARTAAGAPVVAVELDQVGPPRSVVAATAMRFDLTPSEADVLALVARGLSNMEIARALYVSIPTVKTHVHRLLAKLGVASRVQAVLLARKLG